MELLRQAQIASEGLAPSARITISGLLEVHEELTNHARETMKAKNHDYTGGNQELHDALANFRHAKNLKLCTLPQSVLIRLTDKVARLATFTHKEMAVKDESLKDTVEDLINYAILFYAAAQEDKIANPKV